MPHPTPPPSGRQYRTLAIELEATRELGDRELGASLSSEELVRRPWGDEELVHTEAAVDLSRGAANGFPLLWNHDADRPLGRVRGVRVDGGRLRGVLAFSPHAEGADRVLAEVRDGWVDGVSVGYTIQEASEVEGSETVKVTRWTPHEFSITPVPADATVGPGRSDRGASAMPADHPATAAAERRRQSEIRAQWAPFLARGPRFAAELNAMLDSDANVDQSAARLLAMLGEELDPLGDDVIQREGGSVTTTADLARVRGGETDTEKFLRGAQQAIEYRTGWLMSPEERSAYDPGANPMQGYTLAELVREYLRRAGGGRDRHVSRHAMVGDFLSRAGVISHGTADFANLLVSISEKSMMRGWSEADESWRLIARIGSLPDYKQAARVNLSTFQSLEVVPEGGEYKIKQMSDVRENIQLAKYGAQFGLTREALLNDDLDAFTRVPARMGRAAARVPGDLVYNTILIGNPALNQDSTTIFHANHNNQVAAGGAAPSVATVSAARTAMAKQTDPQATVLGIRLAYVIVPTDLEDATRTLQAAEFDPAGTAGTLTPNSQRGRFQTVAEHRLATDSAAKWYASADPMVEDTIEIAFLGGVDRPMIEPEDQWSTDGRRWKVRLEVGHAALDYRGLYYNVGA